MLLKTQNTPKESLEQFKTRKQNEDVANYLNTEEDWKKEYEEEYSPKAKEEKEKKKKTIQEAATYPKEHKEWENFYLTNFNEKPNFSKVRIPQKPTGNNWRLIIIKKGLTTEEVFQKCNELFNATKYTEKSLDEVVTENQRNTNTHYAIWVQTNVEPDPEYLGKSTKEADPDMKIGITLLERLILEIKYYEENKEKINNRDNHLDIQGITFCSGSRYADGDVPSVDWYGDYSKLLVDWYNLVHSNPKYGLRVAVS